MIWLKIITLFLILSAGLFQIGLDNKWKDQRTKSHRRILRILVTTMILAAILTIYLEYRGQRSADLLQNTVSEINKQTAKEIQIAEEREKHAQEDNKILQHQISNINAKIDPFIEMAKKRYPREEIDKALEKLIIDLNQLQEKTTNIDKQVHKTIEATKSPSLALTLKEIIKTETGYTVILRFKSSNKQPIGKLSFELVLIGSLASRIVSISHKEGMTIYEKTSISSDGQSASISFTPMDNYEPAIVFSTTGPAKVVIQGSHGIGKFIINIQ